MIIEFSIENFRSIKTRQTFSLLATSDKSLINNVFESNYENLKNEKLLKSSAIFGGNATGKSNIILAISFLTNLVLNSHRNQKGDKLNIQPFKFDNKYFNKPTSFEVIFIQNSIKYIYGVSLNNEKIIKEYLYYYPKGRKSLIFERNNTNKYEFTKDVSDQSFISERTLDNALYLSNSTQLKYIKCTEAFDWFREKVRIIKATEHPALRDYTIEMLKNENFKEKIVEALVAADFGISDITATKKTTPLNELDSNKIPLVIRKMMENMSEGGKPEFTEVSVKLMHRIKNDNEKDNFIPLSLIEESEGTQRIFSLIGPIIDTIENGRVIFIDELDTKIHHLLNTFLIKLFNNKNYNKNNAQLLFTTHNVNLLSLKLFRRDQIWFTERDPNIGNTELFSLSDFRPKPRKDKDILKGYLSGRYGAIPFIDEIRFMK